MIAGFRLTETPEHDIANRLHSRERRAWVQLVTAQCRAFLGQTQQAEQEFLAGIALAEAIGEDRVLTLLSANLAVVQSQLGRHDEALKTAADNLKRSSPNLLYTHFESLRCMAEVHLRRNELDDAEKFCDQADALVSPTESRVSRLWLGPLHIGVLMAQGKHDTAREKLTAYEALVADCQSPRFTAEAGRLAQVLRYTLAYRLLLRAAACECLPGASSELFPLRLCRRMWGKAMPCRSRRKDPGLCPWYGLWSMWAKPEPGAKPQFTLLTTARRSLAAHPAAKPKRGVLPKSCADATRLFARCHDFATNCGPSRIRIGAFPLKAQNPWLHKAQAA